MRNNSPSQREECLFDTLVRLCTCLQESKSKLIGELSALFHRNGTFLVPVALVSNEDFVDSVRGVLLNVRVPGSNVWGQIWLIVFFSLLGVCSLPSGVDGRVVVRSNVEESGRARSMNSVEMIRFTRPITRIGPKWCQIEMANHDMVLTAERLFVGDIVYQQDTHGASVVCRGDGSETLLS